LNNQVTNQQTPSSVIHVLLRYKDWQDALLLNQDYFAVVFICCIFIVH
jgi:hypothetical protein